MSGVDIFKSMGDETRLRVLMLLKREGETCVCDLVCAMAEGQPKISRHLALLRKSGLIVDRRESVWVYYAINPQLPRWIQTVMETTLLGNEALIQDDLDRLYAAKADGTAVCC